MSLRKLEIYLEEIRDLSLTRSTPEADAMEEINCHAESALMEIGKQKKLSLNTAEGQIEAFFDKFKAQAIEKFEVGRREHGDDFKDLDFTAMIMEEVLDIINYHCMSALVGETKGN